MDTVLLAIETATPACSAALFVGTRSFFRFTLAFQKHAQLLLPMISELLDEAGIVISDVGAIAVGAGPGSFTGVRIAMSAAQGLGFALQCPLYPVSTLEALAYQAQEHCQVKNSTVIPALDARMEEVYILCPRTKNAYVVPFEAVLPLINFPEALIGIGSGWDNYQTAILGAHLGQVKILSGCYPHAKHIGLIAKERIRRGEKGKEPHAVLPCYVRNKVAEKKVF